MSTRSTRSFTQGDATEIQAAKDKVFSMYLADLISRSTYEQATAELVDRLNEAQGMIQL